MTTEISTNKPDLLKSPSHELANIALRSAARKANPNLRHEPNANDLKVASEHARLMAYPQYQAMPNGGEAENEL